MTVERLNSLEDSIRKPGYLLFLVIVLLFLIIGFVNLLSYETPDGGSFIRGSIAWYVVSGAYLVFMLAWASLLLRPNDDGWLIRVLTFVQSRPIIALGVLAIDALILIHMFRNHHWLNLPALQVTVFVLVVLSAGLLLFYRWGDDSVPQLWRKLIVYTLGVLLLVELALQALTLLGLPPSVTQVTDSFAPYSRVYQNDEGQVNGIVNGSGWNYPGFRLAPDSQRIILLGDSFVQALQIPRRDNMGKVLEGQLEAANLDGETKEVLALGNPDYGPGLYLDPAMLDVAVEAFAPDEVIVLFDIRNDFQTISGPNNKDLYFFLNEQGDAEIHEDSYWTRHRYQHEVLRGYEGFQLNRFLRSHYLTPQIIASYLEPSATLAGGNESLNGSDSNLTDSLILSETNSEVAMSVAKSQIELARDHLQAQGVNLRLVTIPAFTADFLDQGSWTTQLNSTNLLLPEAELRAFAAESGIPFLGLGTYMENSGLQPEQVKTLYFGDGEGHFTQSGHEFAANALLECFFANRAGPEDGCDNR